MAANYIYEPYKVSGIYEMAGCDRLTLEPWSNFQECMNYNTLNIDRSRIRSCIGEFDEPFGGTRNGVRTQQIAITGYGYIDCGGLTSIDCIQEDGSGWFIVTDDVAGQYANHCYAYMDQCVYQDQRFSTEYYQGCQLECKWSLESNLNWLISKVNEA